MDGYREKKDLQKTLHPIRQDQKEKNDAKKHREKGELEKGGEITEKRRILQTWNGIERGYITR